MEDLSFLKENLYVYFARLCRHLLLTKKYNDLIAYLIG